MSRFFSKRFENLEAYVPGEQPRDKKYIKLNTNESPYFPTPLIKKRATEELINDLRLYPDTNSTLLAEKIADTYNVRKENVVICNGSDEALSFCFSAFCDTEKGIAFADITYGLYEILGNLYGIECEIIPLNENFEISVSDYCNKDKNIIIANPNAPTGRALTLEEIEEIVKSNPDNIVIIDEAYVDFGGESAVPLIKKYDNLAVVQTFSKSRSLAGARLGFLIANEHLTQDINTVRCSLNPYNINTFSQVAGLAAFEDADYFKECTKKIIEVREKVKSELEEIGFEVIPSKTNFLFAKHNENKGEYLYSALKERGILVRHFNKERISNYIRITIGDNKQMETFIKTVKEIINTEDLKCV